MKVRFFLEENETQYEAEETLVKAITGKYDTSKVPHPDPVVNEITLKWQHEYNKQMMAAMQEILELIKHKDVIVKSEEFEKGKKPYPIGTISHGRKKIGHNKWRDINAKKSHILNKNHPLLKDPSKKEKLEKEHILKEPPEYVYHLVSQEAWKNIQETGKVLTVGKVPLKKRIYKNDYDKSVIDGVYVVNNPKNDIAISHTSNFKDDNYIVLKIPTIKLKDKWTFDEDAIADTVDNALNIGGSAVYLGDIDLKDIEEVKTVKKGEEIYEDK